MSDGPYSIGSDCRTDNSKLRIRANQTLAILDDWNNCKDTNLTLQNVQNKVWRMSKNFKNIWVILSHSSTFLLEKNPNSSSTSPTFSEPTFVLTRTRDIRQNEPNTGPQLYMNHFTLSWHHTKREDHHQKKLKPHDPTTSAIQASMNLLIFLNKNKSGIRKNGRSPKFGC